MNDAISCEREVYIQINIG